MNTFLSSLVQKGYSHLQNFKKYLNRQLFVEGIKKSYLNDGN